MPKSIVYLSNIIDNKNPHRLANSEYYLVYISDDEWTLLPALFTRHEIGVALNRALKNPEDTPLIKMGWIHRFIMKFKSVFM